MREENKIKKVVILAGGEGTRLSEKTELIPKPLVEIGNEPILIHIMRHFYNQGYREFIIAVGYMSNEFKAYFRDYSFSKRNVTFTKYGNSIEDSEEAEDWIVKIVETGPKSSTSQRLNAVKKYLNGDDFFLTYGDSVSNVDLSEIEKTHYNSDNLATITAVGMTERFGILKVDEDTNKVIKFSEKTDNSESLINGGFIACRNTLLNEVNSETGDFSFEILTKLSSENKLGYYYHPGFWHAMDTKKDYDNLNKIYKEKPDLFK